MMSRNPYRSKNRWNWEKAAAVIYADSCCDHYIDPTPEAIDASIWAWKQVWKKADGRVTVNDWELPSLTLSEWRHAAKLVYDATGLRPQVWATSRPYQLVP